MGSARNAKKRTRDEPDTPCVCCDKTWWVDGNEMLLCDTCDNGFHLKCLAPPLKSVPRGNWDCPQCSSAEEEAHGKEGKSSRGNLKRPRKAAKEEKEEGKVKPSRGRSKKVEEEDGAPCEKCGETWWEDGNEMLLCDECDKGYHLKCLKPALKAVPKGKWFGPCCK